MPWFKVDDKFHDHTKSRRARKSAIGVWCLAGSWCMDQLTDGFVPESILGRWGSKSDAKLLVEVRLWDEDERDGEKGWQFRNWLEFQPSKEEVEAERSATKERVQKWRNAKRNAGRNAVTPPVTNEDVTPNVRVPRPDPTRPDHKERSAEPNAQPLVAEWIEHCPDRPPSRVIGQVAKEVKTLIDDGIPPDRIRKGLAEWHTKGLHPATIPSVVHELSVTRLPYRAETDEQGRTRLPPLPGNEWSGR